MSRDDQQNSLMVFGDNVKDKIVELMTDKTTDLADGLVFQLMQLTGVPRAMENCQTIANESVNIQKRKIDEILKVLETLREDISNVTKRERSAVQCLRAIKDAVEKIGRELEGAFEEFQACQHAKEEIARYAEVYTKAFQLANDAEKDSLGRLDFIEATPWLDWGCSHQFIGTKRDKARGVFVAIVKERTTVLRRRAAANVVTGAGVIRRG